MIRSFPRCMANMKLRIKSQHNRFTKDVMRTIKIISALLVVAGYYGGYLLLGKGGIIFAHMLLAVISLVLIIMVTFMPGKIRMFDFGGTMMNSKGLVITCAVIGCGILGGLTLIALIYTMTHWFLPDRSEK